MGALTWIMPYFSVGKKISIRGDYLIIFLSFVDHLVDLCFCRKAFTLWKPRNRSETLPKSILSSLPRSFGNDLASAQLGQNLLTCIGAGGRPHALVQHTSRSLHRQKPIMSKTHRDYATWTNVCSRHCLYLESNIKHDKIFLLRALGLVLDGGNVMCGFLL
jgi:hypothetical protein